MNDDLFFCEKLKIYRKFILVGYRLSVNLLIGANIAVNGNFFDCGVPGARSIKEAVGNILSGKFLDGGV